MSVKKESGPPGVSITPLQQMVSSCSGALVTSLLVTPLDVVKIRLQAQQKPFRTGAPFIYHNGLMDHLCICSHCLANGQNGNGHDRNTRHAAHIARSSETAANLNQIRNNSSGLSMNVRSSLEQYSVNRPWYDRTVDKNIKFTGTIDTMLKIARTEGITSLWSGLPPTLVMAVPATVVYFTTYDVLKYRLGYREGVASTQYIPVLAGTAARTFTTTLISPLELIRTKIQSEQLSYRDLGKVVRATVKDGGVSILLRGLGPTLLRDVPFSGFYWFGYEFLKTFQMRQAGNVGVTPTISQSFVAGALSGTVAALITLPFDVIKTHRQIELGRADFSKGKKLTSTWSLIMKLYTENGVKALFAGIVPRLAKVTPACALMITSYEYGKAFFRDYNQRQAQ